ncbi:serine/threonine protein kinase [Marinicellulosiphila megalodicopiae]|uniref:serine/threonine protein kinase n=1 Tax=Marinicellulosiphila megalodicopiae TaxID=2724896 RepID=UPI003BAE3918
MSIVSTEVQPFDHLSQDLILDAIESAGLLTSGVIYPLNSYENRVYYVGIDEARPVVVKIYRPDRWSLEQINEELEFINELDESENAVIAPLKINGQINGQSYFEYKDYIFAIWPLKGGSPIELDNEEQLYLIGQKLGRIHLCAQKQKFEHRPTLSLLKQYQDFCEQFLKIEWIDGYLLENFKQQFARILPHFERLDPIYEKCKKIRVHGDFHPGNIMIRDEEVFIVDFDDSYMGPAICDIWMLLSGEKFEHPNQLSEILEGYEIFLDFDRKELQFIDALQTLRIMQHPVWIVNRWNDPAFKKAFSDIEHTNYWQRILNLISGSFLEIEYL